MSRTVDLANQILRGTLDLHVHTFPDIHLERAQDDIEYAEAAVAAGMRGAVLKNHHTLTADRAAILRKFFPTLEVFGGLCLDASVGGLTPFAVETGLRFVPGQPLCKIFWMPTIHALEYGRSRHPGEPGYSILDEEGRLLPEVFEIIDLIRDGNAAMATGHLPLKEQRPLLQAAKERGLERVIVTHVDAPYLGLSIDDQKELSRYAYLEHSFIHTLPTNAGVSMKTVASSMRAVGFERCLISSDLGQAYNPPPVDGMRYFILALLNAGVDADDIALMARETPRHLLNLESPEGSRARIEEVA